MTSLLRKLSRQITVQRGQLRKFDRHFILPKLVSMDRTYEDAVKALNSLQSNAAILEKLRKSGGSLQEKNLPFVKRFAERAGIKDSHLDAMNAIHISGTKGKGSVCAFCESILRHSGYKTGFYSSPHLMEVRERIRINGKPLPKEAFSKYFWMLWDTFQSNKEGEEVEMPNYFRFLTIMSFFVFHREKVDVGIFEVGIGGAYDATNILKNPYVCGMTSLGRDHLRLLGGSLETVAWHKTGIFKAGVPAVTIEQPEVCMKVAVERSEELKAPLSLAPPLEDYNNGVDVGLEGEHQKTNASLAMQICKKWLEKKERKEGNDEIPSKKTKPNIRPVGDKGIKIEPAFDLSPAFREGIKNTRWAGRSQVIFRPKLSFYLDGAHTPASIEACIKWFNKRSKEDSKNIRGKIARVLLFNSTGGRDPNELLRPFLKAEFDHVMFCPNLVSFAALSDNTDLTNFTVTQDSEMASCMKNQRFWRAAKNCDSCRVGDTEHRHTSKKTDTNSNFKDLKMANGFDKRERTVSTSSDGVQEDFIVNGEVNGLYYDAQTSVFPCITHALQWVALYREPLIKAPPVGLPLLQDKIRQADHVQCLVTGSLHLVGGTMSVLGSEIVGEV